MNNPSSFDIKAERNLLSLKAKSIPLQDLLAAIAEKTGIKINVFGSLTQTVSITTQSLATEVIIKRLLTDYNHIIIYFNSMSGNTRTSIKQINIYIKSSLAVELTHQMHMPNDADFVNHEVVFSPEGINQQLELIEALGQRNDKNVVPTLDKLLSKTQNQTVKHFIIETLGKRQGRAVVDSLAKALNDETPTIRVAITDALINQKDSQAPLILAQILYGDPDPEVRALAAEALAVSNSEHMQIFLEMAQNDPDKSVRIAATLP